MDLGNPNKEIISTYLDLQQMEKDIKSLGKDLTETWVKYMGDTLTSVLEKLEKDDQDGAQKVFLDALDIATTNSETMVEKIAALVGKQIGEIYQVAYNEGAMASSSLAEQTIRKLMDDGQIEDPTGGLQTFLDVSKKHHQTYMSEIMKGKNLNIYSVDKKKEDK